MSDLVGNIQSSGGAQSLRSATTVSASKAASSYAAAAAEVRDPNSTISSLATRYRSDPVAGIVTQYLDVKGDVVNQVPSTLALTYLRAGLTPDGMHRRDEAATSSVVA